MQEYGPFIPGNEDFVFHMYNLVQKSLARDLDEVLQSGAPAELGSVSDVEVPTMSVLCVQNSTF